MSLFLKVSSIYTLDLVFEEIFDSNKGVQVINKPDYKFKLGNFNLNL